MITTRAIAEIQIDKPTLTQEFIREFDVEWERAVRMIKRKVRRVKKDDGVLQPQCGF